MILSKYSKIFNLGINEAIKPFVWWEMPEEYSHLCVVRAFARWITISKVTNGYLFRKIRANDRIAEENEPMVHTVHLHNS